MKFALLLTTVFGLSACQSFGARSAADAAQAVLARQFALPAGKVDFEVTPAVEGRDVFEYEAAGGKLTVRGSSPVAMCRGFYDYMRDHQLGMVTRYGMNVQLPKTFPDAARHRVETPFAIRQYHNVVTSGYMTPYWDFAQWEKELDYLALHGFNMVMAPVATEAIQERVWKKLGFTQQEIDDNLVGPAHLPWYRMGNIQMHDGHLPPSWHKDQIALQHRLLKRMRELGIQPIVQGFAGFVPAGIKRIKPGIALHRGNWNSAMRTDQKPEMIMPSDPLFAEIEKLYLDEWTKEFGDSKYILVDSFNEMELPKSNRPMAELLADYGAQTYEAIRAAKPDAVWVLQGWMLGYQRHLWNPATVRGLLSKVPNDRLLILDYAYDYNLLRWGNGANYKLFNGYDGKSWAVGYVPNMGNKNGFDGDITFLAHFTAEVLNDPKHGNLSGFCIDAEGCENNEVLYELMADTAWKSQPVDLNSWTENYCENRYGAYPPAMKEAWDIFKKTCWGRFKDSARAGWMLGGINGTKLCGDPRFIDGALAFLSCRKELANSPLYRTDALELAAAAMGDRATDCFQAAARLYSSGATQEGDKAAKQGLQWLTDLDTLLSSHAIHRLDRWLNFTRKHGGSDAENAAYESNAKRIVTIWGPGVNDYSSRMWSGLVRDFYRERMARTLESIKTGKPFNRGAWEEAWVTSPGISPAKTFADPMAQAEAFLKTISTAPAPSGEKPTGEVIGYWNPAQVKEDTFSTLEFPLSPAQLRNPKTVHFHFTGGNHRLDIQSASIVADGKVIAEDKHDGIAGTPSIQNTYHLDIPKSARANNGCLLRAIVTARGGNNSSGQIEISGK